MFNKETTTQSSGNNSTNINANNIVNQTFITGVTEEKVNEIIDARIPEIMLLSGKANETALRRIEEANKILLQKLDPTYYERFEQPEVQYSLRKAQIEYAKTGDAELQKQILSALIERIKSDDRSLRQITFDQAITVVTQIPKDYLDVLSLLLILNITFSFKAKTPDEAVKDFALLIAPFLLPSRGLTTMQSHLISCGCATGMQSLFKREYMWGNWLNYHFGKLFANSTDKPDLKAIEQYFADRSPVAHDLFKFFETPVMQNIYLTPVGKVIAAQNYTIKTKVIINLDHHFQL